MAQPMYSHGSVDSNFPWVDRFKGREPSVFMAIIIALMSAMKLICFGCALGIREWFMVSARLIDTKWAWVTSAIRV